MNPVAAEFAMTMSQIHKETCEALKKATDNMKTQYDKKKRPTCDYQVGDKVWLDTTNLHLPWPKKKLDDKHIGPFTILDKAGAATYKLKLPPHWKIHPCFNKKLLTLYIPLAFPNWEIPPPPPSDLIDNEEYYEIEEVLDSHPRMICGGRGKKSYKVIDYFVKWKGWMRQHNSWVQDSEMGNAQEAIEEYEQRMCDARRIDIAKIINITDKTVTMILDHEPRILGQWWRQVSRSMTRWTPEMDPTQDRILLHLGRTSEGVLGKSSRFAVQEPQLQTLVLPIALPPKQNSSSSFSPSV